MKKINSIWYGANIIKAGLVFVLLIPFAIYLFSWTMGLRTEMTVFISISVIIGIIILSFMCILLAVELRQDKRINSYYEKNRNKKVKISEEYFECQNCGSQKVKKNDRSCPMCGIKLNG